MRSLSSRRRRSPSPPPLHPRNRRPRTRAAEAASELHRRLHDLLSEARTLHEEGRNQEALGVLARIAILDEENAEAHELEGKVRTTLERAVLQVDGWIAEGVQAFDRGDVEAARALFEKVLEVAPEHREALQYMEMMPAKGAGPLAPAQAAGPRAFASSAEPSHAGELAPD